jgi:uncharacterized protein
MKISSLILAAASLSSSAWAFDCAKATLAAEKLICRSESLKALDTRMGGLYAKVRAPLGRDDKVKLLQEQRAWLSSRNRCTIDLPCLEGRYKVRIADFTKRLD